MFCDLISHSTYLLNNSLRLNYEKKSVRLWLPITCVALVGALMFSGCSKDNGSNPSTKGKIDDAVGTYKGTLSLISEYGEFYDAIIIVTKEGNDQLKVTAKSGEAYSGVTSKTFQVEVGDFFNQEPIDIVSLSGVTAGLFHYDGKAKTALVNTSKQGPTEINFRFEGDKQ